MTTTTTTTTTTTMTTTTTTTKTTTTLATVALCSCSLIHAYVLISVFPYSGYMVITLIPNLTTETAGMYAGILASSFMVGRACSSYPWGIIADTYGRKFVLIISLLLSGIFSYLFGLSTTFVSALLWRFLLGLSNGIVGTVKTIVSEMTTPTPTTPAASTAKKTNNGSNNGGKGDADETTDSGSGGGGGDGGGGGGRRNPPNRKKNGLETRIMGLVVGMRAWGFLYSPAIGGWLAEPIRQYPWLFGDVNNNNNNNSSFCLWCYEVLSSYPFLLPNLFGALMCIGTALVVALCIPETLPAYSSYSSNHQNKTIMTWCSHSGSTVVNCITRGLFCCRRQEKPLTTTTTTTTSTDEETAPLLLGHKITSTDDGTAYTLKVVDKEGAETGTTAVNKTTAAATMSSLWHNQSTKDHLISYWLFSLAVGALDDAFPLFCIATKGGLGLSEGDIGKILSLAGLVFASSQYIVYINTTDRFGLYPSLSIGCAIGFVPIYFIPISQLINNENSSNHTSSSLFLSNDTTSSDDNGSTTTTRVLHWPACFFLMMIMAISKIFCCMFFTSMSIALNKTVDSSQRATLNGLATLGGSVAKAAGPLLAGWLVTASLSWIGSHYGSMMIFTTIGCLGLSVLISLGQLTQEQD